MELPPLAHPAKPFDLATVFPEAFGQVLRLADRHDAADVFLLSYGDPVPGGEELALDLEQSLEKSLAVVYFGGGDEEKAGRPAMQSRGIPVFPSPERAMVGLGAAVSYARFLSDWPADDKPVQHKKEMAASDPDLGPVLEPGRPSKWSRNTAFPIRNTIWPGARNRAASMAGKLGCPVVLKVVAARAQHKSDVGGVTVGVASPEQAAEEYRNLVDRVGQAVPGIEIDGVLVCRQAEPGLEVIVGAVEDPIFGPTVMFGLGGVFTEVLQDVSLRLAPLERKDAEAMIREIKGYPLLKGLRGNPPCDLEKLADLLMSVSRLVTEKREIKELDLNPVRVYQEGLLALDVRIMARFNGSSQTGMDH